MSAKSKKNKIVIGITGGFSSGKTTAVSFFAKKGALRIDADKIAHTILKNDVGVKKKLIKIFGNKILSGDKINRKKLGETAFSDKGEIAQLGSLLHPKITKTILKNIKESKREVVVVDAPLLIETGLSEHMDLVVLVSAARARQLKWAVARGFSVEQVKKIVGYQLPLSFKKAFADFVINNDDTIEKIKKGVDRIWQGL